MDTLRDRIRRHGPVPFSTFMEEALYGSGGFYTGGGGAGRRRDFLTSPEVGPLFGAVLARALDVWWNEAGRPDPYVVVEAGAGPGTLARAILHAEPRCLAALRYILVDRSEVMRASHPAETGAAGFQIGEADEAEPVPGQGPSLASRADIPPGPAHVILANELLDNLPFDLFELGVTGWDEVRMGVAGPVVLGADPRVPCASLAPDAPTGGRIAIQYEAAEWVADARQKAARVVVFDYCTTTASMSRRPWTDWCRTYHSHRRGAGPMEEPGSQDITAEVAVDQLPRRTADRTQAEFLRAHGIEELVAAGRRYWTEHAARPDLRAVEARSRTSESEALLDPTGLGAFRVLEWY